MSSRRTQPLPPGWHKLRHAILRRDRYTCGLQLPGCQQHATDVDHIIPASEGGSDDPANLQAVCRSCHKAKTAQEANRARWAKKPRRTRKPERHPGLM